MCIDNLKGFLFMEGIFSIGHFTVVLMAKPMIWSEAEVDCVVIETSMTNQHDNKVISI